MPKYNKEYQDIFCIIQKIISLHKCHFPKLTPTITAKQGIRMSQMRVQHQNMSKYRPPAPSNSVNGVFQVSRFAAEPALIPGASTPFLPINIFVS